MSKIVNLTQHTATPEQTASGVVPLIPAVGNFASLAEALTFHNLPTRASVFRRAEALANAAFASGHKAAMIGGAPFLMGPLETALRERGIKPLYAFSQRESVEEAQADGSIRKVAVFRHVGFVEAA